jgi:hypothetical protein
VGKYDELWKSPTGKSLKVRIDPKPKRWAFVPRKYIKSMANIASCDGGFLITVFEVAQSWIVQAGVMGRTYPAQSDAILFYKKLEGGTDILAPEAAAPMPKPSRPEQIELLPDRKKDAPW